MGKSHREIQRLNWARREGGISLGKAAGDGETSDIVAWRKQAGTLRTAASNAALAERRLRGSVCEPGGPDLDGLGERARSGFHSEFTPTLWGVRSQEVITCCVLAGWLQQGYG